MSPQPPSPAEARRDLVLLALGAGLLFVSFLGAHDLWDPNEPLYGQAVVEMDGRQDWLIPTVNGEAFPEKPILYFWLALAAAKLFGGVSEFTLRLPSALAGVGGVLLVYLLVLPYTDRTRARIAAALTATTYIFFWTARLVQMDLLLTVCCLAAVLSISRVLDHGFDPRIGWSAAGLASAMGVLTKGPVGLIVPGLVVLGYAVATRRGRRLLDSAVVPGAMAFLLASAPWFVALWARGESEFLRELLYRQNFERFVAPWDHQTPWWYFLREFWIDMAPWSFFVPLSVALPARDESARRLDRLAWTWIVVVIVFFSLSASKRSPYIMSVAPAAAILVSGLAERWMRGHLGSLRLRACSALTGLFGLLLVAGAVVAYRRLPDFPELGPAGPVTAALLLVAGLVILAGLARPSRDRFAAPAALFAFVLTLYLTAAGLILPAVDVYKSWRPFGEQIMAQVGSERPLYAYRIWKWRAAYTYFSGRPVPRLETEKELIDYWASDEQVFLIVERGMLDEVQATLGEQDPLVAMPLGSNFVYLFSNR